MSSIPGVTTYIPAVLTSVFNHETNIAAMVETDDYELSGCYVKFTDYEDLRRKYLELKRMPDSLEK